MRELGGSSDQVVRERTPYLGVWEDRGPPDLRFRF